MTKTGTRGELSRPNHRKQRNDGDDLGAVRAVGVACARWAWRARGGRGVRAVGVACARWAWRHRENSSVKSFFRKKAKDKRKK